MAGLLPNYILREWNNDGRLLSGGKVYFYESGTLTPKPTYTTYLLNVQHTNPVILDAGGAADIWLGDGAYRVLITDSNGVQIRSPIDGIVGVGAGTIDASSNATMAVLKVYNDLRALTSIPDVVYLTGREEEGDGGAGLFQLQPGSTDTDDDGMILVTTTGSRVYKRIFDGVIDPLWYGVAYGPSVDQALAFQAACAGSVRHDSPVDFKGVVFLGQNVAVPALAHLKFSAGAYLVAGAAVSVTFADNSGLDGDGVIFGTNVNPSIGQGVCDAIRLSWMGGAGDFERWSKLAACSVEAYSALMDISTTIDSDLAVPANFSVKPVSGAILTIAGPADLEMILDHNASVQCFSYSEVAYIQAVSLGTREVFPEWFGAVGDGVADDSLAMYACAKSGRADLLDSGVYLLGPLWASLLTPTPWTIQGGAVHLDASSNLGTGTLNLQDTVVVKASGSWFAGAVLIANQSEIPPTYTATIQSVTGCVITGSDKFPRFRGKPRMDNGHLDILSAKYLNTDSNGKINDGGDSLSLSVINVAKLVLSSLASTPTLKIFNGSTVLTNPMPMFLAVITASYSNAEIYLPIPVKANNDPNLIFVFRRGVWQGQRYWLKSQSGVFYKTGTISSEEFKDYIIAYFDYDEPGWVTLGSN